MSGIYIFFEKTVLVDTNRRLTRKFFWDNIKQVTTMPCVPIYTITLTFLLVFHIIMLENLLITT